MRTAGWLLGLTVALAGCAGAIEEAGMDPAARPSEGPAMEQAHRARLPERLKTTVERPDAVEKTPGVSVRVGTDGEKADAPRNGAADEVERIEDLAAEAAGKARRLLEQELAALPPIPKPLPDDLETGARWRPLTWGNRAAAVSVTLPRTERGGKALRIAFRGGTKDKAAISRLVELALPAKGAITADLYPSGKLPVKISLAVFVGGDRVYYESKPKSVEPGRWNRLRFDVGAAEWKCASSQWKYNAAIWKRDDVREIVLLIYNGKLDGAFYLGALAADRAPKADPVKRAAEQAGARPQPPQPAAPAPALKDKPAEAPPKVLVID